MDVERYVKRLRLRVGEAEYERHKEIVLLLARNLSLEDVLWEEITENLKDITLRNELLKQRNQIVKDIHTEFRALKIEVPSLIETKTEGFASFLEDLTDEESSSKERDEESTVSSDR